MYNENNYLTEDNLIEFVQEFISRDLILDKQFKPHKFRPDILIEDLKIAIEFDGFLHYTQPTSVIKDKEKTAILKSAGYKVIRIPYYIQLDSNIINYLFPSLKTFRPSKYKHGFIDKKVILPAAFCELGVERFEQEINTTFSIIKSDIIFSIKEKIIELENKLFVLPPSLLYLLD